MFVCIIYERFNRDNRRQMNVLIYDIETMQELFLIHVYDPKEDKHYDFLISQWQNNFDAFVKLMHDKLDYYWVGYNNLRFDAQVVEWVIRNHMIGMNSQV